MIGGIDREFAGRYIAAIPLPKVVDIFVQIGSEQRIVPWRGRYSDDLDAQMRTNRNPDSAWLGRRYFVKYLAKRRPAIQVIVT